MSHIVNNKLLDTSHFTVAKSKLQNFFTASLIINRLSKIPLLPQWHTHMEVCNKALRL